MIKQWLFNILLKRGATALEEWAGKVVRHGMTTYGGVLMANGLADSSDVTAISGGLVAISGIIISVARIYVEKKL